MFGAVGGEFRLRLGRRVACYCFCGWFGLLEEDGRVHELAEVGLLEVEA